MSKRVTHCLVQPMATVIWLLAVASLLVVMAQPPLLASVSNFASMGSCIWGKCALYFFVHQDLLPGYEKLLARQINIMSCEETLALATLPFETRKKTFGLLTSYI